MAKKVRIFNGKKFGLLNISPARPKKASLVAKGHGHYRVVKVKGGYALYFRSHHADVEEYRHMGVERMLRKR